MNPPSVADVAWDTETLLDGRTVDDLLDDAEHAAEAIEAVRGRVATLDAAELAETMAAVARVHDAVGRASSYVSLRFAVDTADESRAAAVQHVTERATALATRTVFFDLEWAELPDEQVESLLTDPGLSFCDHHLRSARRYRPHLLSEAEELVLTETQVVGRTAWQRLFNELTSAITIELDADDGVRTASLQEGLSLLEHPDRSVRQAAASAVTRGLEPGLRTRTFVFNTLLADKSIDDRLRRHDSWISSRNLANEASDASVEALVGAVVGRYEVARRWYRLKARVLGVDRLADYDRAASLAAAGTESIDWPTGVDLVLDAYDSFSPVLARDARRFFDERWIDAPVRPNKRLGAFCAYTVPSHHPYLLLNWTNQPGDVLTLAHELGHGLHALVARHQGVFHQTTPLTVAETASVFGERVTFERLLDNTPQPDARLALLAQSLEGSIATVFRQVAMNRFEHAVHTERRSAGELAGSRIGELWASTQRDLFGDSVEVTDDYHLWWSYIPHFVNTPGYVYAYAYGQLLALSVYARYREEGPAFVPRYLDMLAAGGSRSPEELGRMVGCDLEDPGFWDAGLDLVDAQLDAAEAAAHAARGF